MNLYEVLLIANMHCEYNFTSIILNLVQASWDGWLFTNRITTNEYGYREFCLYVIWGECELSHGHMVPNREEYLQYCDWSVCDLKSSGGFNTTFISYASTMGSIQSFNNTYCLLVTPKWLWSHIWLQIGVKISLPILTWSLWTHLLWEKLASMHVTWCK